MSNTLAADFCSAAGISWRREPRPPPRQWRFSLVSDRWRSGGLIAATHVSASGDLLLDDLHKLRTGRLGGAARLSAGRNRQDADRHAAHISGDGDRYLRIHRDVRLLDVERDRKVVEHVLQVDVHQGGDARSGAGAGASASSGRAGRGAASGRSPEPVVVPLSVAPLESVVAPSSPVV